MSVRPARFHLLKRPGTHATPGASASRADGNAEFQEPVDSARFFRCAGNPLAASDLLRAKEAACPDIISTCATTPV